MPPRVAGCIKQKPAPFLARNCGERGGGARQGQGRYAVDHGRALTGTTPTHKRGQYEEGAAAKQSREKQRQPPPPPRFRLPNVGEHIALDSDGLLSHAGVCDTAAAAIPAAAPSVAGHLTQATTAAVAQGHTLIDAVAAQLSNRVTATGTALRTAAKMYSTTDSGNAQSISTTVQV